jgi:hypothetical protein
MPVKAILVERAVSGGWGRRLLTFGLLAEVGAMAFLHAVKQRGPRSARRRKLNLVLFRIVPFPIHEPSLYSSPT